MALPPSQGISAPLALQTNQRRRANPAQPAETLAFPEEPMPRSALFDRGTLTVAKKI
ncbi:hypothetical protein [Sphingomonas baiyangensis]|uniref:hypothetical protein n=1 Tax=Sphingomonas baiyangensis TaxID=2572576 RepID=UPI00146F6A88|nr:hypothetical protein [Sphingomonas baiyangensis]